MGAPSAAKSGDAAARHVPLAKLTELVIEEAGVTDLAAKVEDFVAEVANRGWLDPGSVQSGGKKYYSTRAIPFVVNAFMAFLQGATFEFLQNFIIDPMAVFAVLATAHRSYDHLIGE